MTPTRLDSAQLFAAVGAAGGFILAHYDRIAATLCALAGLGYTLWRWRKEARAKTAAPFDSDSKS